MKAFKQVCKNNRGFTVAELAITLAIIAILASMAIPSVTNWLPNYRLRKALTDLRNNFQHARLEAVKSNCNCTITFNQAVGGIAYDYAIFLDIDNNLEYDGDLTADAIDNDNDGTVDEADEVETVIVRVSWSDYNNDVRFDTTQGGGDGLTFTNNDDVLPSVAFRSTGLPRNNAGGLGNGSVFLTNTNGTDRSVVLSSAGMISIQ